MGRRRAFIKQCPTCGTADLSQFGKNRAHTDGFQTYCKVCTKMLLKQNWSKEARKKTKSQKKDFDTALVEKYLNHLRQQE